ncbi:MAG: OmpA family protein, partial [Patescibacteria group bacterium]
TVPVQEQEGKLLSTTEEILDYLTGALDGHIHNIEADIDSLERKIVHLDPEATAEMKAALATTVDEIRRWIREGHFGGPVFSPSFLGDSNRYADMGARIFLEEVEKQESSMCSDLPTLQEQSFLGQAVSETLTCGSTFNEDQRAKFLSGEIFDDRLLLESQQTANDYWNLTNTLLDQKIATEEQARQAISDELAAGQGYYAIRDEDTGATIIPASYVHDLVTQALIESPFRQTDTADKTQTALPKITDDSVEPVLDEDPVGTPPDSEVPLPPRPSTDFILFDLDSVVIQPEAAVVLDEWAEYLVGNPGVNIGLDGYASTECALPPGQCAAHNLLISQKRANAALGYLASRGVDTDLMPAVGQGETTSFGPPPQNRRVVIR